MPARAHALAWAGLWVTVCWTVMWWGLGFPSFWDPDEAHYAQTTKEMLESGNWLVPTYDGKPFFDKPILFHLFQLIAFAALGPTEFAARSVPAASAMAVLAVVAWFARTVWDRPLTHTAALMLAVLPATFALTAYAILDMTFTLFLFGSAACLAVAALRGRGALEYFGYVLLAAAVLTKGPVAIILAGLSFLLALWFSPSTRAALLRLHWGRGLAIVAVLSAPWFAAMWAWYGSEFIDGYALRENLWLYIRPTYANQPSVFFYPRVAAVGLLPWTPILIGRVYDAARGQVFDPVERWLWAWVIAIVGFFSLSHFKLDHYVYPAAPALCLLAAKAWHDAHASDRGRIGVFVGALASAILLIAAGAVVFVGLERAPIEISPWARLLPIALVVSGLGFLIQLASLARGGSFRLPAVPWVPVSGLVAAYAVLVQIGLPAIERAKPVRTLAQLVARSAAPTDHVCMYRMNRWSNSWRFYVGRSSSRIEAPGDFHRFISSPGRHYCGMRRVDYNDLVSRGIAIEIAYEAPGLFTTSGRALRRGAPPESFVVVTDTIERNR